MTEGWDWLLDAAEHAPPCQTAEADQTAEKALEKAFAACLRGRDGELVLGYLRRVFLDRRLPPSASDAELRHAEGQRTAIAHILALVARGKIGK